MPTACGPWSQFDHNWSPGTLGLYFLFRPCAPGTEDAKFERVKKLIAAAAPEFQIPHGAPSPARSLNTPLCSAATARCACRSIN